MGENVNKSLYDGSIVYLTADGANVTSSANISVTIKDSSGTQVSTIDNSKANTYTITYKVTYGTYSGTCSNKIIIKEQEKPADTPVVNTPSDNQDQNNSDSN